MLFWLMSKHHSFYTLCLKQTKKDPLLHTSSILKPGINGKKGSNLVVNNSDYLFQSNRLAVMNLSDVGGNKLYFIKLK